MDLFIKILYKKWMVFPLICSYCDFIKMLKSMDFLLICSYCNSIKILFKNPLISFWFTSIVILLICFYFERLLESLPHLLSVRPTQYIIGWLWTTLWIIASVLDECAYLLCFWTSVHDYVNNCVGSERICIIVSVLDECT